MLKNLAQNELNVIEYIIRDSEKPPVINPEQKPISWIITHFHIIFIYPRNFTILSSITQEIIYHHNFDMNSPIKLALYDIYKSYVMVSGYREMEKVNYLEYSFLESEDKDAWKQYLKKGHIKLAMQNCTKSQKPYVAGIYADQLF